MNRAEQAMYLAEKFEKNRVMTEADLVTIKERINTCYEMQLCEGK